MSDIAQIERQAVLDDERAKWLSVKEAAYVLRTDEHTIQKAIHAGHLELFALGKVWRIHIDSLKACQKSRADWQELPNRRPA